MRIFGHRGASAVALENTLTAFRRAETDGADGVELDVMLCRTGEVVVFHDIDLFRLARREEQIGQLSLDEVRAVRLRDGETIPTLREVFAALGPAMRVNVEIKAEFSDDAGVAALVDAVAREVRALPGAATRVIFSSFDARAMLAITEAAPEIPRGVLVEADSPMVDRVDEWIAKVAAVAVHPEDGLCRPEAVRAWRARGLDVNAWTVDDGARLRALRALDVTTVITNDPARARAALAV